MNKIIKKTLKIVLPILLGGFILYWVYRDFDFERAKEVLLHGTDWGWMLLSLLFGVMSHVLRGWRWRPLLRQRIPLNCANHIRMKKAYLSEWF